MSHFYISAALFSLLSSCAFIMLTSRVATWKKLYIVLALTFAGVLSYRTMNSLYGQPQLMQDQFEDVLIVGFWPDKANKTIYIWIKEHDKLYPVSYKMPYSMKLHKQLQKGRSKHKGKPYRSKIKGKNYPLKRFGESMDEIEAWELPIFPPKAGGQ